MTDEMEARLVRSANSVLKAFKSGLNPTFQQLANLEAALFPHLNYKVCGHLLVEDCDCEKGANRDKRAREEVGR